MYIYVNNALTSYIRLCNYVMLNLNEPIKVAHLEKLANQSVLNGALMIEKWLNNSFRTRLHETRSELKPV